MVKSVLMPASAALLGALAIGGCAAQNHGAGGGSGAAASVSSSPVGVFTRAGDAPAAFAGVAGSAELKAGPDGGSDASISLRGLRPNVTYIAHVHQGTCDQPDPGGPHFKFDPDGPDTPPNEIHLRFAANASGSASALAHSTRAVPARAAGSIVVHEDPPPQAAGAATGKPKAAPGHEHHAGAQPRAKPEVTGTPPRSPAPPCAEATRPTCRTRHHQLVGPLTGKRSRSVSAPTSPSAACRS